MKSMLMAIMAVAVAVTFSAPAFAGEEQPVKKEADKKGGHVLVYAGEGDKDKKAEEAKKPKFTDTFADPKEDKKKPEEKGK